MIKSIALLIVSIIGFIAFVGVAFGLHPFETEDLGVRIGLSIFAFGFSTVVAYFGVTGK